MPKVSVHLVRTFEFQGCSTLRRFSIAGGPSCTYTVLVVIIKPYAFESRIRKELSDAIEWLAVVQR